MPEPRPSFDPPSRDLRPWDSLTLDEQIARLESDRDRLSRDLADAMMGEGEVQMSGEGLAESRERLAALEEQLRELRERKSGAAN